MRAAKVAQQAAAAAAAGGDGGGEGDGDQDFDSRMRSKMQVGLVEEDAVTQLVLLLLARLERAGLAGRDSRVHPPPIVPLVGHRLHLHRPPMHMQARRRAMGIDAPDGGGERPQGGAAEQRQRQDEEAGVSGAGVGLKAGNGLEEKWQLWP